VIPSPAQTRDPTLRVGAVREPHGVAEDVRICVRVPAREVKTWNDEPKGAALVTAETTTEGIRLLGTLRIAIATSPRRNAS
jgi:hypothetical protein